MDHALTMRSTYERINAGGIAGFGDLVADGFIEHQGAEGFLPPRRDAGLLPDPAGRLPRHPHDRRGPDRQRRQNRGGVNLTDQQGDFMGVPPTGARVDMQLIDIMRF
jgi:hypothetical protein